MIVVEPVVVWAVATIGSIPPRTVTRAVLFDNQVAVEETSTFDPSERVA